MDYFNKFSGTYHNASSGVGFTTNGKQYPAGWFQIATSAQKIADGFLEIQNEGTPGDPRLFYVSHELDGNIRRVVNTPKSADQLIQLETSLIEDVKNKVRATREQILNRLAGIAISAQLGGDNNTVSAYLAARVALLDITKDLPTNFEGVAATIDARYKSLVIQALTTAPQLETAFNKVDI